MRTLENMDTATANEIFEMYYFNYELRVEDHNNGTSTIVFDDYNDAEKFIRNYINL